MDSFQWFQDKSSICRPTIKKRCLNIVCCSMKIIHKHFVLLCDFLIIFLCTILIVHSSVWYVGEGVVNAKVMYSRTYQSEYFYQATEVRRKFHAFLIARWSFPSIPPNNVEKPSADLSSRTSAHCDPPNGINESVLHWNRFAEGFSETVNSYCQGRHYLYLTTLKFSITLFSI